MIEKSTVIYTRTALWRSEMFNRHTAIVSTVQQRTQLVQSVALYRSRSLVCLFTLPIDILIVFSSLLVPPFVTDSEQVTVVQVTLGKSTTLVCPATGIPTPTIHWFRNDQPLPQPALTDQYILQNIESTDEGVYRCVATNKAGTTFRVFNVSIQSKDWTCFLCIDW